MTGLSGLVAPSGVRSWEPQVSRKPVRQARGIDGRLNALAADSCSDPEPPWPTWFLVRRLLPGQAAFEEALASVLADDVGIAAGLDRGNTQAFVLSDPAADAASEPAAVALVQPLGDAAVEIRLSAGRPGAVLARLLVPVLDALRAQGVRRATSRHRSNDENVASAFELVGFHNHGGYFAMEL